MNLDTPNYFEKDTMVNENKLAGPEYDQFWASFASRYSTPLGANLKIWFFGSSQNYVMSASIVKVEVLPKREV